MKRIMEIPNTENRVEALVYAKLHGTREEHIEAARRARDYQAKLVEAQRRIEFLSDVIIALVFFSVAIVPALMATLR